MKILLKNIKRLFSKKIQSASVAYHPYIIKYVSDGDLSCEHTYRCLAINDEMAYYDFFDCHNELYCDIISIKKDT